MLPTICLTEKLLSTPVSGKDALIPSFKTLENWSTVLRACSWMWGITERMGCSSNPLKQWPVLPVPLCSQKAEDNFHLDMSYAAKSNSKTLLSVFFPAWFLPRMLLHVFLSSMGSDMYLYRLHCSWPILGQQMVGRWPTAKVNFWSKPAVKLCRCLCERNTLQLIFSLHIITMHLVAIITF